MFLFCCPLFSLPLGSEPPWGAPPRLGEGATLSPPLLPGWAALGASGPLSPSAGVTLLVTTAVGESSPPPLGCGGVWAPSMGIMPTFDAHVAQGYTLLSVCQPRLFLCSLLSRKTSDRGPQAPSGCAASGTFHLVAKRIFAYAPCTIAGIHVSG